MCAGDSFILIKKFAIIILILPILLCKRAHYHGMSQLTKYIFIFFFTFMHFINNL